MQLRYISQINDSQIDNNRTSDEGNSADTPINAATSTPDDRLFIMFHGYGNDEHEMIRIINAVYDIPEQKSDTVTHSLLLSQQPSYLSFRGTYDRPYMGGAYWYPDGCTVEERRRACEQVSNAVVSLLDSTMFTHRRKILVGFSQGGYLAYRMIADHPTLFDAAILLSPSCKGEDTTVLTSPTRIFLAYGANDHTIPYDNQITARRVLNAAGHLEYHEYPGMAHAICDQEITDIRDFLSR